MLRQHFEKCKQHFLCRATCFYYETTFFKVETNFSIFKQLKKNRKYSKQKLKKIYIFKSHIQCGNKIIIIEAAFLNI